jgi:hypothetical protein
MKPALIRFAVRDTLFSFRANNGILELKRGVGEILLFVPVRLASNAFESHNEKTLSLDKVIYK